MRKFIGTNALLALLSGFITAHAVAYENYILIWISYIPLFYILDKINSKQAFNAGLLFGLATSITGFYWMIPGAQRFTGSSIFYGIVVFIISSIFFCLFFALLPWVYSKLKRGIDSKWAILSNALLITTIYCVGEALLMYISSGFPWFDYHSGYALSANILTIQPAAFFGIHALTFSVILVNYLCAAFISKKQWIKLTIPAFIIGLYVVSGYVILQNFKQNLHPGKTVNVAILSENIQPEIKWDDNTGNILAGRLLDMSRNAAALKPDIAVWSESAIPWTYRKNDDLIDTILKITRPSNITHILGINTEVANKQDSAVFNSAYCLLPDGTVAGRYDKQVLLALIEKPIGGAIIPFMSSNGFIAEAGKYNLPLTTPYGKAGIIICNESATPSTAYTAVNNGAEFICNMSNDGWFNNTYIVGLHFYNARLRAVETRKDVVVNSNDGFSGLIKASGEIAVQERSEAPVVRMLKVTKNNYVSLVPKSPNLFVIICGVILIGLSVIRFTEKQA